MTQCVAACVPRSDKTSALRKHIPVAFALSLACVCAKASWLKVAETDAAVFYADPASVLAVGNYRRVWTVIDFKSVQKDGIMSIRGLEEYDCVEQRVRFLSQTNHPGKLATGAVLSGVGPIEAWDFIPPNSPLSRVMAVACTKL